MPVDCRRRFRDGEQIGARRNQAPSMNRHPLTAIGGHQAITHLQIGLLVSEEIGMKPLLLFGWQIGRLSG